MNREQKLLAYTEHVAKTMCILGQNYHVQDTLTVHDDDLAVLTFRRTNKEQGKSIHGELIPGEVVDIMECRVKIEYKNDKWKMTEVEEWRHI